MASNPNDKIISQAVTFDDVLLVPRRSSVVPSEADLRTQLSASITLNIPLLSAPMDTVTESSLAIALAQEGGIGVIHKNLSPEVQAREVEKVKRSASGIILDPVTLGPNDTITDARKAMARYNVSGFPVTEDGSAAARTKGKVLGILTRRDLKFAGDNRTPVRDVMTPQPLVTAPADCSLERANEILNQNKVEKLILIDANNNLAGLVTRRDIDRQTQFPLACTDDRGRLRCAAAVGVHQDERIEALINAGVDALVVDTAHGHSQGVLDTVKSIKSRWNIDVIAGNIATATGARDLIDAGADAVKVGIGPGSICTTRIVTGVGVPQISAIMDAVSAAKDAGIPVIADGGVRNSGDIAKALAAGASAVMMGSLFAGLEESPGELVISQGRRYKTYRGMGSEGAMNAGSADRYSQADKLEQLSAGEDPARVKFVPEGVEGLVPYKGKLAEFVYQMVGGVRSAMGYCGCPDMQSFRTDTRFCRITSASVIENHPHDIRIMKEAPNYTSEHLPRA